MSRMYRVLTSLKLLTTPEEFKRLCDTALEKKKLSQEEYNSLMGVE